MKKDYELKAEVLSNKYSRILKDFEEATDDRRIAWNCYQMLLTACKTMSEHSIDDNFIRCAVNDRIHEQEAEIDEIITRFLDLEYRDYKWVKPLVSEDAEGICPVCGAELEYDGDDIKTCGGGMHPWKCPACGATGEEGYNEVFDGQHYNVRDKDGNKIPTR